METILKELRAKGYDIKPEELPPNLKSSADRDNKTWTKKASGIT